MLNKKAAAITSTNVQSKDGLRGWTCFCSLGSTQTSLSLQQPRRSRRPSCASAWRGGLTSACGRPRGWWAGCSAACSRASPGSSSSCNPRRCSPAPSRTGSPKRDGAAEEVRPGGTERRSFTLEVVLYTSSPRTPRCCWGICFLLIPRQRFRSLLISSPVRGIRRHAYASCACTATLESDLVVVDSRDLLESLLPDHDGGEVGGVAGQHQQAEDGPEVHEEAPGPAFRRLQIKRGGEDKRKAL